MAEWKEVRAKTGEDRDGKAIYRTIGRTMTTKAGPMLKLDVIPLGWDGWAYISDPKPKDNLPDRKANLPSKRLEDMDNEIPF